MCLRHRHLSPRAMGSRSWCLALLMQIWSCVLVVANSKPNIIIILADDMGWNDISFHGSDQIPTPNIDALAYNGVILNSHYVPALCTPSRSSLLTGKYPTSIGMQHMVILAQEPWGLPLEETLMPQHLRRHGYSTHAVGKWHLGFHQKTYTPTYRGFDSFYGYYNGYQDYYDHTMEASDQDVPQRGLDMRRNLDVDYDSIGKYSTDAFTDEAVSIIHNHDDSHGPLFLYLAHLAPHTGNSDKPYQAPDSEIAKFSHIQDPERRVYAAMVSRLDQSVGCVMTALRTSGKLDNSIVIFLSDNGAVTFGVHSNHGSNFPLRGLKESPWEGGVRGVAAVWSPLLNRTRRVSNQLMHVSDWLPTLYSAAGLDASELGDIDGKDMWAALSHDLESPRAEVFNNYDQVENYSSLRIAQWKYVSGTAQDGEVDSWYGDTGAEYSQPPYVISDILNSPTSVAIAGLLTEQQLKAYPYSGNKVAALLTPSEILSLRKDATITCSIGRESKLDIKPTIPAQYNASESDRPHSQITAAEKMLENILRDSNLLLPATPLIAAPEELDCNPRVTPCLFNLEEDPCEEINLARVLPALLARMEERLAVLKRGVVPPLNQPGDPMSNPIHYNNTWVSWCDPEHATSQHFDRSHYSFESINIVIKILTMPITTILTLVIQTLFSMLQRLLSILFAIVCLVLCLVVFKFSVSLFIPFVSQTKSSS